MNKIEKVWVIADAFDKYPALLSAACELGQEVNAFWIGSKTEAEKIAAGANKVYTCDQDSKCMFEDYASGIAQKVASDGRKGLILLSNTKRGKALAAKLSVILQAPCVNDITDIVVNVDGSVNAKHMVYGGLAYGNEKISGNLAIVTAPNNLFEPKPLSTNGEAVVVDLEKTPSGVLCKERKAKQQTGVDLAVAKRIVGVGRGIAKRDDLDMMKALAQAFGAEMGCSRPIAEAEKWMDRDLYIGVTGVQISPDIYVAVGISGQIQHMVGVNAAKTIFAINKDKAAPVFQMADYGIVGDLYKIVPALTRLLS